MKKRSVLICIVLLFVVTGCGTKKVSEFDYRKALEERDQYKEKYLAALEEKSLAAESARPTSYADAWVKSSFGENALWAFVGDNYLQVIVPTMAAPSAEETEKAVNQYVAAVKSLAGMDAVNPEHFDFKVVIINYLDDTGSEIFTLQIKKGDNGFEADTKSVKSDIQAAVREGFERVPIAPPVGETAAE